MENTSSKPLVRWSEISANVAIIVVAVAIVPVFTKIFSLDRKSSLDLLLPESGLISSP